MRLLLRHQSGIALLGLIAYVIAAFGFLPSSAFVQDWLGIHGAERFPCESHACGCFDADSCFDDCCCFSPDETLAWAFSNHVDPVSWAKLDLTPLQEPEAMPDDCPLCALDEPEEFERFELPSVAPLGCKEIGNFLRVAAPFAPKPPGTGHCMSFAEPRQVTLLNQQHAPDSTALDIPAPPPRSA